MKIKYMGTAAAEAIPALFCQCDLCEKARKLKGKNIRGRSGAVLDDHLMVDFPPDVYMHSLMHDIDLSRISDVVVTHTHLDHFDAGELMMRFPGCFCHIKDGEDFINVHGNEEVERVMNVLIDFEYARSVDYFKHNLLKAFETYEINGFKVTPLPALHKLNENAFYYIFEKEGKTLLYANDTGVFYDNTFEYFKQNNIVFDMISFDCTCGLMKDGGNHMGIPDNIIVRNRLKEQGNVNENTKYIITHFSHNCGLTHEELVIEAEKEGFIVAYDGMEIEI